MTFNEELIKIENILIHFYTGFITFKRSTKNIWMENLANLFHPNSAHNNTNLT